MSKLKLYKVSSDELRLGNFVYGDEYKCKRVDSLCTLDNLEWNGVVASIRMGCRCLYNRLTYTQYKIYIMLLLGAN